MHERHAQCNLAPHSMSGAAASSLQEHVSGYEGRTGAPCMQGSVLGSANKAVQGQSQRAQQALTVHSLTVQSCASTGRAGHLLSSERLLPATRARENAPESVLAPERACAPDRVLAPEGAFAPDRAFAPETDGLGVGLAACRVDDSARSIHEIQAGREGRGGWKGWALEAPRLSKHTQGEQKHTQGERKPTQGEQKPTQGDHLLVECMQLHATPHATLECAVLQRRAHSSPTPGAGSCTERAEGRVSARSSCREGFGSWVPAGASRSQTHSALASEGKAAAAAASCYASAGSRSHAQRCLSQLIPLRDGLDHERGARRAQRASGTAGLEIEHLGASSSLQAASTEGLALMRGRQYAHKGADRLQESSTAAAVRSAAGRTSCSEMNESRSSSGAYKSAVKVSRSFRTGDCTGTEDDAENLLSWERTHGHNGVWDCQSQFPARERKTGTSQAANKACAGTHALADSVAGAVAKKQVLRALQAVALAPNMPRQPTIGPISMPVAPMHDGLLERPASDALAGASCLICGRHVGSTSGSAAHRTRPSGVHAP